MSRSTRWMPSIWVTVATFLGTVLSGASGLGAASYPPPTLPKATQAWSSVTGNQLLCVAGDQIWLPETGVVRVLGIEHRDPQTWTIRDDDVLSTWKISQQADTLRTEVAGQTTGYRRLKSVPADCVFKEVPIGQPQDMSWERRDEISREIHERMQNDEAAGREGNFGPTSKIVIENREYLKTLIQEIGWI